jgi:hypothetical protein
VAEEILGDRMKTITVSTTSRLPNSVCVCQSVSSILGSPNPVIMFLYCIFIVLKLVCARSFFVPTWGDFSNYKDGHCCGRPLLVVPPRSPAKWVLC